MNGGWGGGRRDGKREQEAGRRWTNRGRMEVWETARLQAKSLGFEGPNHYPTGFGSNVGLEAEEKELTYFSKPLDFVALRQEILKS